MSAGEDPLEETPLLDFLDFCWARLSVDRELPISEERGTAFFHLGGICIQAVRHAVLAGRVAAEGWPAESRALARAALEHAVTARWIILSGDEGLSRLESTVFHSARTYIEPTSSWLDVPEAQEALDSIPVVEVAHLPKFSGTNSILSAFEPQMGPLTHAYRRLSQSVHVSHATFVGYLDISPGGHRIEVDLNPADDERDLTLLYAASAAAIAMDVLIELEGDHDWLEEMSRAADDLHLIGAHRFAASAPNDSTTPTPD